MIGSPNRDRRAEQREATRLEILEAAWEVARTDGLAAVTLREVAAIVGMQAPSLYTHFPSKNAIYDAMYGQAWMDYEGEATARLGKARPRTARAALKAVARTFFDFSTTDLARHQLMNQRSIPDFQPSAASYAPAVRVLDRLRVMLVEIGVTDPDGLDLFTALIGGLVDQQLANDPGGTRWRRLLDRAMDMYADEMGLPGAQKGKKEWS
jgi:AcrR family transcriptional regulator